MLRRHSHAAGARPLAVARHAPRRQRGGQVVDLDTGEEREHCDSIMPGNVEFSDVAQHIGLD